MKMIKPGYIRKTAVLMLFLALVYPEAFSAKKYRGFFRTYEEARQTARQQHQILMIEFTRKGCFPSKQLNQEVFRNRKFLVLTDSMVCVRVDGETGPGRRLMEKYEIPGYPTILFTDPEGNELERITSVVPLDFFLTTVRRIFQGKAIAQLEKKFPDQTDYHELYTLSLYYARNVFDKEKLELYFEAFKKEDPAYKKDSTVVLSRYILQKELRSGIYSAAREIEAFVYDVPEGNSYKLAILLTDYYLKTGQKREAWDFFSGYYMLRENKGPIEAYYQNLKKKLGKED